MGAPAIAAGTGGLSFFQAQQQNRAISGAIGTTRDAHVSNLEALAERRDVAIEQTSAAAEIEMMKNFNLGLSLQGRARAAAASRGTTTTAGGTPTRIVDQTALDRLRNARIIDASLINTIMAIDADFNAGALQSESQFNQRIANLRSQFQNPIFSALTGAIQGYTTGIQL